MEDSTGVGAREQLEGRIKSGASWFFWIAGLSLINSCLLLFGSDRTFIIGLGVTQVVDVVMQGIAEELGGNGKTIALAIAVFIDLLAAGVLVLFGVFARKRHNWAFIVGMILYALDGLIFLLVGEWLSVGFHVFALVCIFTGLQANMRLTALDQATPSDAVPS